MGEGGGETSEVANGSRGRGRGRSQDSRSGRDWARSLGRDEDGGWDSSQESSRQSLSEGSGEGAVEGGPENAGGNIAAREETSEGGGALTLFLKDEGDRALEDLGHCVSMAHLDLSKTIRDDVLKSVLFVLVHCGWLRILEAIP